MPLNVSSFFTPQRTEKTFSLVQRICLFIMVIVPIVEIVAFICHRLNLFYNVVPLPALIKVYNIVLPSLAGAAIIFLLASLVFCLTVRGKKKNASRDVRMIIANMIGIPMCCIFSFLSLSPDILSSSAQIDDQHYFVVVGTEFGDHFATYNLFKCDENDLNCIRLYSDEEGGSTIYPTYLTVDHYAHEIHLFVGRWLRYTDGSTPRGYQSESAASFDETVYYLDSYVKDTHHTFVISKCIGQYLDHLSCVILPFRYSTGAYKNVGLVADKNAKKINLIIDDVLILTYDTAPHCIATGCVILDQ